MTDRGDQFFDPIPQLIGKLMTTPHFHKEPVTVPDVKRG
jgi:hypothetical protein